MPARKSYRIIQKIMNMRADGMQIKTIARKLKIHPNTSRQYCHIADKIMSLNPQKIQEALLELQKYQPRSMVEIKRKERL
jgi:hypothetical protein